MNDLGMTAERIIRKKISNRSINGIRVRIEHVKQYAVHIHIYPRGFVILRKCSSSFLIEEIILTTSNRSVLAHDSQNHRIPLLCCAPLFASIRFISSFCCCFCCCCLLRSHHFSLSLLCSVLVMVYVFTFMFMFFFLRLSYFFYKYARCTRTSKRCIR